ncbi:MAG: Phosphatidate cytidylyltransferase [Calditrichaeota bacterium]|nr:Phosphatidate cytidylyltransferase [Calditrichota bacterium]
MKKELIRRAFVIIWGVPLVTVCAWFGGWVFTAGVAAVSAIAIYETMKMLLPERRYLTGSLFAALLAGLLPFALALQGLAALLWLFVAALVAAGSLAIAHPPQVGARLFTVMVFSLTYICFPFTAVLLLRHDPVWSTNLLGAGIVLYLWGGVWVADTAAYFVGRRWGRIQLAALVSPNKTVEGAVACIVSAFVWTLPVGYAFGGILAIRDRIALGAIIGILAIIGDLAESSLKRAARIKDTGGIFPGHGGMLDRFDSQLFVQPAAYLYLVAAGVLAPPSPVVFNLFL